MPILSGADILEKMVECEDEDLYDQWEDIQDDHDGGLKFTTIGDDEIIGWYTYEMTVENARSAMTAWKAWFVENNINSGEIEELDEEAYDARFSS